MCDDLLFLFYKLDSITFNHSIRVMGIAREVEDFYDMDCHVVSEAALVHDIGKVYISSKILDKPDRLSGLERGLIDLHPYIGYRLLRDFGISEELCRIVLYHHGTSPATLEELPPPEDDSIYDEAMLLNSIDAFEALTSDRPYHVGCHVTEAFEIMHGESGHHEKFMYYLEHIMKGGANSKDSLIFRNGLASRPSFQNVFLGFYKPKFTFDK